MNKDEKESHSFPKLKLKDFKIETNGLSEKRLGYKRSEGGTFDYRAIGFLPMIESLHFEFGLYIHSNEPIRCCFIGMSNGKHSKKDGIGQNDQEGWGWTDNGFKYGRCFYGSRKFIPENRKIDAGTYGVGDLVGFEVDKEKGKIFALKNEKKIGVLFEKNNEEDKEYLLKTEKLQICFSFNRTGPEIELVHFKDLSKL